MDQIRCAMSCSAGPAAALLQGKLSPQCARLCLTEPCPLFNPVECGWGEHRSSVIFQWRLRPGFFIEQAGNTVATLLQQFTSGALADEGSVHGRPCASAWAVCILPRGCRSRACLPTPVRLPVLNPGLAAVRGSNADQHRCQHHFVEPQMPTEPPLPNYSITVRAGMAYRCWGSGQLASSLQ